MRLLKSKEVATGLARGQNHCCFNSEPSSVPVCSWMAGEPWLWQLRAQPVFQGDLGKQSQPQGLELAVHLQLGIGGLQPGPQDLVGPPSDPIRKHLPVGLGVRGEG